MPNEIKVCVRCFKNIHIPRSTYLMLIRWQSNAKLILSNKYLKYTPYIELSLHYSVR